MRLVIISLEYSICCSLNRIWIKYFQSLKTEKMNTKFFQNIWNTFNKFRFHRIQTHLISMIALSTLDWQVETQSVASFAHKHQQSVLPEKLVKFLFYMRILLHSHKNPIIDIELNVLAKKMFALLCVWWCIFI